jgi:type II secretory pathway pseudopilin PulG
MLMTMMAIINKSPKFKVRLRKSEDGLSLIAVLAAMTIFAIALLAVAPTVQQGVQREKELEQIRRGEEIAEAIQKYIEFHQGSKLPNSIDDLLEGLPHGTKKRQILRPSAAIDPLSEDGKWRLITPTSQAFINFAKRVQTFSGGVLPSSPSRFDQFAIQIVNAINTGNADDLEEADEEEIEIVTDSTPFIGVASQSRSKSVIAYYGIENHSKWIYTPLFRGSTISGSIMGLRPNPNANRSR